MNRYSVAVRDSSTYCSSFGGEFVIIGYLDP